MQSRLFPYFAATVAIVAWGATFASTMALLDEFSALEILVIRFGMAWAALRVVEALSRKGKKTFRAKDELLFVAMGFTGVVAYQFLENCAIYYTNASNIAILVSFGPVVTATIAQIAFREKLLSGLFVAGSLAAACGGALVSLNGLAVLHIRPIGDFMAVAAMISWGVYSALIEAANRRGIPSVVAVRKAFFWSLVLLAPFALWGVTDGGFTALDGSFSVNLDAGDNAARFASAANWANLAFLGLVASAACFALWNVACNGLGVVRASVGLYLIPLTGVLFAIVCLGETVSLLSMAGGALILAGVAVANKGIGRKGK